MPTDTKRQYPIFVSNCHSFDLALGKNTKEIQTVIDKKTVDVQTVPVFIRIDSRGHSVTITRTTPSIKLPNGKYEFNAEAVCPELFNTSATIKVVVTDYDIKSGYGHMSRLQ